MCETVKGYRQELFVNALWCFLSGLIWRITDIGLSFELRLIWTFPSSHGLRHHSTRSQIPSFTRLRCPLFTGVRCPPSQDSDALLLKTQMPSFTRLRCPPSLDSDALLLKTQMPSFTRLRCPPSLDSDALLHSFVLPITFIPHSFLLAGTQMLSSIIS